MTTFTTTHAVDTHREAIAAQITHSMLRQDDEQSALPLEQQSQQLDAIVIALQAMQDSRKVNERAAQVESDAIQALDTDE